MNRCRGHPSRSFVFVSGIRCIVRFWLCLLLLLGGCRIGEASVPGPDVVPEDHWSIGVSNPSGLLGKSFVLSTITADVVALSETHLTKLSKESFVHSLKSADTGYSHFVAGAPVAPRSIVSEAGAWAGVGFATRCPSRALSIEWPPDLYETSRIQFCASYLRSFWLTGAVVYGYPAGVTHPHAFEQTQALLDFACDHLVHQCVGPRFFAGDWNFTISQLAVCDKLRQFGWIEIQDLMESRTGASPRSTCKGKTRKDFLWISPELSRFFVTLQFSETFADHVVLQAVFQHHTAFADRWIWPKPSPITWSNIPDIPFPVSFAQGDPSDAYHHLWKVREAQAAEVLIDWNAKMSGRGAIRAPVHKKGWPAPLKKGRSCDIAPAFHGISWQHAKWFKQLRRLQSYCNWAASGNPQCIRCPAHGVMLWNSILRASGFSPSFSDWWLGRLYQCPQDVAYIPQVAPSSEIALSIYHAFLVEVRTLETHLIAAKKAYAQGCRERNPSKIYQDVKKPFAQPVETLLSFTKTKVSMIDVEDSAIELDPAVTFDPSQPILVNGQPVVVHHAEPDKLWLESLPDTPPGASVVQSVYLGALPEVFEAFHEQWRKRWCRHDNVPHSQWHDIVSFAAKVIPPVAPEPLQVDVDLLRAECHRKKPKAATGLDGASRADFVHAGPNFLQSILNMFSRAEEDGSWPVQVMAGAVSSLAKTPMASSVNEYRPITIFGFAYRCWASIHARHLLDFASTWVDDGVFGNRKGFQAAHLWRTIVQSIEQSYTTNRPLSGLTADIEKAYNCLPRWPVLCAARFAGTPAPILNAWAGAITQMCRHFKVRDSYSDGFQTSTGLAEGCALSCFGMLLLDHLFHHWVTAQASPPVVQGFSYVDNWDLMTWDPNWAVKQLDIVLSFAKVTDLTVDRRKTYGWSTDASVRQQFRQANISVQHAARDLGAHISYTRQFTNATVTARLTELDSFWTALRASPAPYAQKVRALRTVAWPRGLHAVSSAPIGRSKWNTIRSKAVQAILGRRAGISPGILLGLVEGSADPEELALISTIRDLRAFSEETYIEDQVVPLALDFTASPANSPAHILLTRLHQVGLIVDPSGLIVDRFGTFDCLRGNYSEVILRLQWAWQQRAASFVSHRSDFRGLAWVDTLTTRCHLASLDLPHQALFRLGLAGGLFTADASTHWSDNGSSLCKWCGAPDSLHHRYWTCEATQHFRVKLAPEVLPLVDSLPPALLLRGWALHCPSWPKWISLLASLPRDIPPPEVALSHLGWNHVFTDGSCLWQSHPSIRVAAWSAVLASPYSSSWTFGVQGILGSSYLPGLCQSAFRAELYAVAFTLHQAAVANVRVHVWSDCLGVVNVFHLLTRGKGHVKPNSCNGDLWQWVLMSVERLGLNNIRIGKVRAHQALAKAGHLYDVWLWWNNSAADRAARMSNISRPPQFWQVWSTYCAEFFQARRLHSQIVAVHMAVADMSVLTSRQEETTLADTPLREGRIFAKVFDDRNWNGEVSPAFAEKFGFHLCRKLAHWWSLRSQFSPDSKLQWIPLTLLYIDYQLSFGCAGPIKLGKIWVEPCRRPYLDVERFPHSTRLRWFRNFLTMFLKASGITATMATCKPEVEVVQAFVPCVSLCWDQSCLAIAEQWLHRHLPTPCIRDARALRLLPLGKINPSLAVQLPPNTGG